MNERRREDHQEQRAPGEAAGGPTPEAPGAACPRPRDAAPGAPAGAGPDGEEAGRYPARADSVTGPLLADGYTVTWAPDPAGCSLTLTRREAGRQGACRGAGPTMQHAWDEVREQLGHGQPQPAGTVTREAPGAGRGIDRLYRVVQYYDTWPFHCDSRIPDGSSSRKRTDTFRTLAPVKRRLARANAHARYERGNGGDWSSFVAVAEQLTDDGWQPIDVDLLQETPAGTRPRSA